MTAAFAVRLTDAGKRYTKYDDNPLLVSSLRHVRAGSRRSTLWAVRNVDLEIPPGECFGVIGRNGSGKSTLLQMLAGVTAPTEGRVQVRGRVAPLISVGVGFHSELTGRENVYLNGTILGLSRAELDRLFDDIVDFAGVERFIDTPVKFYSSGMVVRLGFAVAIQAQPDVLVVDEVLAVGDFAFQLKCFERMTAIRDAGTTIVVVTHNLNAVRRLCERTLLLHDGVVQHLGDTTEALSRYHALLDTPEEPEDETAPLGASVGSDAVTIESTDLRLQGRSTRALDAGDVAEVEVRARFHDTTAEPIFGFALRNEARVPVYYDDTTLLAVDKVEGGRVLTCRMRVPANLVTGSYTITAMVRSGFDGPELTHSTPLSFYVAGRPIVHGIVDLHASFEVTEEPGLP
ncbi:MAG: hypothetical protein JWN29_1708 [Acidimicrobiales bacterium]|nr:hypothetical protein [Acidimicrobiales bacterium]